MRTLRRAALAAAIVIPSLATANNDLNTSFNAGSISLPSVDGTSASDASAPVAEQGHVSYRIPIVAPPGKSGVNPDLALVYGGRGDGVLGVGWSLSLPEIRVKTSGRGGQPVWGVDETYLGFSGEDLIPAGTLADQDGDGVTEQVFREERDRSFTRYVKLSRAGWRADLADGRRITFGTTSAARVERSGVPWVARWLPEQLVDASGNQLVYTWTTAQTVEPTAVSSTARYLTSMRWGCQACATATAYQELRLAYHKRADLPAPNVQDFSSQFLVMTELYLASITTASHAGNTGDVRTYTLGYAAAGTRLALTSVAITTADAALPAIKLAYTTAAPPSPQPQALTSMPGVLFTAGVQPMDLDKDGRVDIVDLSSSLSAKLYLNTGATGAAFAASGLAITSPPGALPTSAAVDLEDEDHDLGMDVFDLGRATVYHHQGASGWAAGTAVTGLPAVAMGSNTVRADVDLDGYPDLIDTSKTNFWTIYFNDGAGGYGDTVDCVTPTGSSSPTPQMTAVLHASDAGVVFGDVNGDGLVDVSYVDGGGHVYVFPGRGRGCWGYLPEDGLGTTNYAQLTLTSAGGQPVPADVHLADVDGDGYADLVEIRPPNRLAVWRAQPGAGWVDTSPRGPWIQTISTTSGCRIADFDGDGIAEILCSSNWKLYDFANQIPFLLSSVDTGRGLVTTFRYTTSARVAAAHAAAGTAWSTNVAAAIPVISTIEEADGRGHILSRSFDYRDAYYLSDAVDARFQFNGFAYVAERRTPLLAAGGNRGSDPADAGALIRRYYDVGRTDWYQRGMQTCEETWPSSPAPTSFACQGGKGPIEARLWENHTAIDPTYGFATVQVDAEDRFVAEGTGAPSRLRTEWDYDGYGNRISEIRYGRYKPGTLVFGSDERVTLTDVITDTTAWSLRLPSRIRVGKLGAAGAFTAMSVDYSLYDGATSWQTQPVTRGLLTSTVAWFKDPITGAAANATTSTRTYTATGMVDLETDAAGTVTDHDYDGDLGLFEIQRTVDPSGLALVAQITVDSRTGAEVERIAPDGATTSAGYDLLGRLRWLARPGASEAAPTVTRSYVDAAPLSSVTEATLDGTANGLVTTSWLDGRGHAVCEAHESDHGKVDVIQRDFTARGALALELAPYHASACDSLALSVTAGAGARSTARDHDDHVVDALLRSLSTAHSDGTRRTWSYAPLAITESDEEDSTTGSSHAGTPTTRRFDGLGRAIGVDETHLALDDDPGTHSMGYTWDALGNLARVTDGNSVAIYQATYDSRSRRVRSVDADLGQTDTSYDPRGLPLEASDARGIAVHYTWDAAGRVEQASSPEGTTIFHYDASRDPSDSAACFAPGRLTWVEDPSGSEELCYDAHGNVTENDKTVAAYSATPLVTARQFDALDRPTSQTNPDGTRLGFAYGDQGKLTTVRATSGSVTRLLATLAYRPTGQIQSIAFGNGMTQSRFYDNRQRLHRLAAGNATTTLQDLTYGYDNVGNVTSITDVGIQESASFAYDDLYRVASASGPRFGTAVATYRYDRTGNLTRKESTDIASPVNIGALSYSDPTKLHAVTAAVGVSYSYDAAGHLDSDGTRSYGWNDHGLLASVSDALTGDEIYSVQYDHGDHRVFKHTASGDTVVYVPAASAELRTRAGVATWIDRVVAGGIEIACVEGPFTAANVADHIFFPVGDMLGSSSLLLDAAGAVRERTSTHPWGEDNTTPLAAAGTLADYRDASDPTTRFEHRFQGREIDGETGDYDFGARMYLPLVGRFMSADTIVPDPGASQSWNRFAFVRNNPLRNIDPSGHGDFDTNNITVKAVPGGDWSSHAVPLSKVPPSLIAEDPTRGVDYQAQRAAEHAGGFHFNSEIAQTDPLAFDHPKLVGEVQVADTVSAGVAVDLVNGEIEGKGGLSTKIGENLGVGQRCTTTDGCTVSIAPEVELNGGTVGAAWLPLQNKALVEVGPQASFFEIVKAKAVLELGVTYSTAPESWQRLGYRLYDAFTGTIAPPPGVAPAPAP
jgi:RHS repeat-associated protein